MSALALVLFTSTAVPMCIPCDRDAELVVSRHGMVSMPVNLASQASEGYVVIGVRKDGRSIEREILDYSPSDLPVESVQRLVDETEFTTTTRPRHVFCSREVFEITLTFSIPVLPSTERELNFAVPELDVGPKPRN